MRTLIDLPESQIAALTALCERLKQSRAAVVRAAIAEYLARHQQDTLQKAFGVWGPDTPDGVKYQHKVRAEW